MRDLLALSTIRRLLLELGQQFVPDDTNALAGQLELWMHQACDDLQGMSPPHPIFEPDGEERVRETLRALTASQTGPEGNP